MRIFTDVVIHRAGIARMRTVIIYAQSTADINIFNRQIQRAQFGKIAHRFFKAGAIITDIGNLRTHMKMHQLNLSAQTGHFELFRCGNQLCGRQTEFAFLTTGIRPFAGRQRRQAHAQADIGGDTEFGRFFNHIIDFRLFFNHDKHLVA